MSKPNRTPILIALGLALALVVGVLFTARYVYTQAARQPVAMAPLPAPEAESAACAELIGSLPDKVAGFPRAELAEPAPAGAAAWQRSSTQRVTLRCGVELPVQYHEYAQVEEIGGARWLRVDDVAPASTLATWFTVDRNPVVAVTADTDRAPVEDIDVTELPHVDTPPAPAPLSQLAAGDTAACGELSARAPESIAEGFTLADATSTTPNTLAWTAPGRDAIVVRCGVAAPANYQPGARLAQVNDIPWFEDAADGTWYALGRKAQVAAYLPMTGGNEAITNVSNLIAATVPAR